MAGEGWGVACARGCDNKTKVQRGVRAEIWSGHSVKEEVIVGVAGKGWAQCEGRGDRGRGGRRLGGMSVLVAAMLHKTQMKGAVWRKKWGWTWREKAGGLPVLMAATPWNTKEDAQIKRGRQE
eukprot:633611-Pelagomonas_calceolata.AAC.3